MRSWTIATPSRCTNHQAEVKTDVSAHGLTLTVFVVYLDALTGGMRRSIAAPPQIQIQ